jgi:hypothetical protein
VLHQPLDLRVVNTRELIRVKEVGDCGCMLHQHEPVAIQGQLVRRAS